MKHFSLFIDVTFIHSFIKFFLSSSLIFKEQSYGVQSSRHKHFREMGRRLSHFENNQHWSINHRSK